MRLSLLATLALFAFTFSAEGTTAGEWLGGQYWGQISGCAHCGGSLSGLGYCYPQPCVGGAYPRGEVDAWQQPSPTPLPAPHNVDELPNGAADGVVDPQVPGTSVIRTSHARQIEAPSPIRTFDHILPIAPRQTGGDVQTITHTPQSERLAPPRDRIVAPNAWSAPRYR